MLGKGPVLACWLLALSGTAHAYESDQLTDREIELRDATEQVNNLLDGMLRDAIERTNRRLKCRATFDRSHKVLARSIWGKSARGAFVFQRGFFRAPGFTVYSAAIEKADAIDKRDWRTRDDVYGDVNVGQSVILTLVGPSSTVRVNGELVGTDKFDHFLNFGFRVWKLSRNGKFPERVTAFDRRSERRFFGLITSKTYSFGDIAANDDGYEFYRGLLRSDSALRLDEGCVVLDRAFDWSNWVDWRYDEALNPPLHTRLVQKRVDRRIAREPERYCRAYEALGGAEYDAHLEELLATTEGPPVRWVDGRTDPWELAALCSDR